MEHANGLEGLQRPQEYQETRSRIFPSVSSLSWWIRVNKAELVRLGALLLVGNTWHVNPSRFDEAVLELGRRQAETRTSG